MKILRSLLFLAGSSLLLYSCGRTEFSGSSAARAPQASDADTAVPSKAQPSEEAHEEQAAAAANDNSSPIASEEPVAEVGNVAAQKEESQGEAPDEVVTQDPTGANLTASECSSLSSDANSQVIDISTSRSAVNLKPDSIVVLRVSGQAKINLDAGATASIRGLCIVATGGTALQIDTSLVIAKMFYFGRGQGGTEINFGKAGLLSQLDTDISGAHALAITGEKVDCQNISLKQSGNSDISCKGAQ